MQRLSGVARREIECLIEANIGVTDEELERLVAKAYSTPNHHADYTRKYLPYEAIRKEVKAIIAKRH